MDEVVLDIDGPGRPLIAGIKKTDRDTFEAPGTVIDCLIDYLIDRNVERRPCRTACARAAATTTIQ